MRVKFPLRFKVVTLVTGLLLIALTSYLVLAMRLVSEDKLAYVLELNQTVADKIAVQVNATLEGVRERLALLAELSRGQGVEQRRHLTDKVLETDPSLLRISIFEREGEELVPLHRSLNTARLEPLLLTPQDLEQLDASRPITYSVGELIVVNRSLPPSAPILSIVYATPGEGEKLVVVADMTHHRILEVVSGASLYEAFVVDIDGVVIAHPDGQAVVERHNLSEIPVVGTAVNSEAAAAGAVEFDWDSESYLGAFASTEVSRLIVVTMLDRGMALAAVDRLVRFSWQVGVVVSMLALIVGLLFARRITNPVARLRDATSEVARGNFDVQVDAATASMSDEIGELARDFQRMASALKNTQRQLVESEKLAAVGQLGAGLTHEIKNPVGAIMGFADLGLLTIDDKAATEESLRTIKSAAERILEIVRNFLQFARPTSGERNPACVHAMLDEALTLVRHEMTRGGVEVQREYGEVPQVDMDSKQLQQVIVNLALNTQEAVAERRDATTHLKISTRTAEDGKVEIRLEDDGPGMPPEVASRVFEPFFTTKHDTGTGLGLAVSYGIVRDHGGSMRVDSELGRGTMFRIVLPASGAHAPVQPLVQ